MVAVESFYVVALEEFVQLAPMLTFNPFTMVQTVLLGGLTIASMALGA